MLECYSDPNNKEDVWGLLLVFWQMGNFIFLPAR